MLINIYHHVIILLNLDINVETFSIFCYDMLNSMPFNSKFRKASHIKPRQSER